MRYLLSLGLFALLNLNTAQVSGKGTISLNIVYQPDSTAQQLLKKAHALYPQKLDSSLIYATQALSYLQQVKEEDASLTAEVYNTLGDINDRLGQLDKAESHYNKSIEISLAIADSSNLASGYFDLGRLHRKMGDLNLALSNYSTSLRMWKKLDNQTQEASLLNSLGSLYREMGEPDSAFTSINSSIAISKEIENQGLLANAYLNLGNWMAKDAQFEEARNYYEQYKSIQEAEKDTLAIVSVLTNLANLDMDQGLRDLALEKYLDALRILERKDLKNDSYAILQSNIGSVFEQQNDFVRAREYFNRAFEVYDNLGYSTDKANVLTYVGLTHLKEGRIDSALSYYNQASELYGAENRPALASLYQKIGKVHYQNREYEEAFQQYQKSAAIFEDVGDDRSLAHLYNSLGATNYYLEDYDTALSYYRQSLEKSLATKDLLQKKQALFNIYEVLELKGQYETALDYYKRYSAAQSEWINEQKNRDILELTTEYETEKKDAEISLLQAEQERNEALIQQQTAERRTLIIGVIALLIGLIGIAWWFIYKIRKEKIIAGQKEKIFQQEIDSLMEKQQLETTQSMLEGQDKERKRLAAELHDRLGSLLSLVKLYFSSMERSIPEDRPDLQESFNDGKKFLDDTFSEVRDIIKEMNDSKVSGKGLEQDIDGLIGKISKLGITIKSEVKLHNSYDDATEIQVYRIAQEALSNALKYSKADEIKFTLKEQQEKLHLAVQDNGIGFDQKNFEQKEKQNGHFGLENMENRAVAIGGTFELSTAEGKGTTIRVNIPIPQHAEKDEANIVEQIND